MSISGRHSTPGVTPEAKVRGPERNTRGQPSQVVIRPLTRSGIKRWPTRGGAASPDHRHRLDAALMFPDAPPTFLQTDFCTIGSAPAVTGACSPCS